MDRFALKEIKENPIILDFKNCKYLGEIHRVLKKKFGFHDYYGENWDALWDLMCDVFFEKDVCVELHNFNSLNKELLNECKIMLEVFDDVKNKYASFKYKIIS